MFFWTARNQICELGNALHAIFFSGPFSSTEKPGRHPAKLACIRLLLLLFLVETMSLPVTRCHGVKVASICSQLITTKTTCPTAERTERRLTTTIERYDLHKCYVIHAIHHTSYLILLSIVRAPIAAGYLVCCIKSKGGLPACSLKWTVWNGSVPYSLYSHLGDVGNNQVSTKYAPSHISSSIHSTWPCSGRVYPMFPPSHGTTCHSFDDIFFFGLDFPPL